MLSVRALGNLGRESAAARAVINYFKDAYSDYYVKDLDENFAGDWCGRGTEAMQLVGEVNKQTLTAALSGKAAGKEVKNAGQEDRQMGWDLTFSTPKSVSLAWAFADTKHKKEIEKAHMEASRRAFEFIEERITTRLGQGGRIRQTALISAASFLHFTSRQGDPQIHSHFVIPNLCIGRDGKIRTIVSKEFYIYKMTLGAFYQAELCMQMQKLGYKVEEGVKGTFRLSSVDRDTERIFSKRAEEINLMAAKLGANFYASQRGVVLLTRPSKTYTTLEERSNVWEREIKTLGLKTNFKRWSDEQTPSTNINHAEIFRKIKTNLTEKSSYFQEKVKMRQLLVIVVLSSIFAGCATTGYLPTPSGRPEIFVDGAKSKEITDLSVGVLSANGWQIEQATDYTVQAVHTSDSMMADFMWGSDYDFHQTFYRLTITLAQEVNGVRIYGVQSIVAKKGTGFERVLQLTSQKAYNGTQSWLESIAAKYRAEKQK